MSENVKKENINSWLVDSDFIKRQNFPDTYYLESLCYNIMSFLKNVPVPIVAKLDEKTFSENHKIDFYIGSIHRSFTASVNYSYFDYITLIRLWASQFYPQYTVDEEIEIPLTDEEMIKAIKEQGVNMNDALEMKKKVFVKEHAVIEKIILKDDQFILNKNDKRYMYMSGTIKNPMSLSSFKKKFISIEKDVDKKKFLEENSTLIRLFDKEKTINVDYQGQQMVNFFKVNIDELMNVDGSSLSPFVWKFGRFIVKFSSQSLMDDCLRYLNNKKEEKFKEGENK